MITSVTKKNSEQQCHNRHMGDYRRRPWRKRGAQALGSDYTTGFTPGALASGTGPKPGAGFGSTLRSGATTGAIPGACATTGSTPGARKCPVFGRGGATMRVVLAPVWAIAPVTLEPTKGISGAPTLDMPKGLTPLGGADGVALDIIQDTRAKEKEPKTRGIPK